MAMPVERPPRGGDSPRRTRLPRMAEIVAGSLRDQILSGELTVLPRLEDLIQQYDVGPPAAREALRILETEGLITVRRGNVGGAEVHLPTADGVAYMVSLVLQSRSTGVQDVGDALRQLEPLCAALCAAREDRHETIVPVLKQLLDDQAAALGDGSRTREVIDRFHDALVQGCGNESLEVAVAALERVWAAHAEAASASTENEEPIDFEAGKALLRGHERLVRAIDRGDSGVAGLATEHLAATQAYRRDAGVDRNVDATTTAAFDRGVGG